jgi:hypothetical protein
MGQADESNEDSNDGDKRSPGKCDSGIKEEA